MVKLTHGWLFSVGYGACVVGLGFPAYTGVSLFLVFLSAVVVGSMVWAIRAQRLVVLVASAVVLITTLVALNVITDELGRFTDLLLIPAFWFSLIGWLVLFIGILRLVFGRKVVMVVASVVTIAVFIASARIITMSPSGYVTRYLVMPTAQQTVAGKRSNGYVHTLSWDVNRILVITRRRFGRKETYWAWTSSGKRRDSGVIRCDDWTAPQFPVFSTSDVYQPCFHFGEGPKPETPNRKLVSGSNFVEFDSDDFKRIRVEW
jgi:hypothetical protein